MDTVTCNYIERSLNIKFIDDESFIGCLTEVVLNDLIDNKYTAVEWQNPEAHDCNNKDGMLYVYLPAIEDCGELFIAINPDTNELYVS